MIFNVPPDPLVERLVGLVDIERALVNPHSRVAPKPN
jgi:hypothetical protein